VPQAEKEFLADVTEVMGKWRPAAAEAELENWGGWWRNRHRQNADKARRVIYVDGKWTDKSGQKLAIVEP